MRDQRGIALTGSGAAGEDVEVGLSSDGATVQDWWVGVQGVPYVDGYSPEGLYLTVAKSEAGWTVVSVFTNEGRVFLPGGR